MNCKPGDLARIVRANFPQNKDHIVRVVRPIAFGDVYDAGLDVAKLRNCIPIEGAVWVAESMHAQGVLVEILRNGIHQNVQVRFCCVADYQLQPIRDQPGEDETLTWKPTPVEDIAWG